jgi:hypothetical protein
MRIHYPYASAIAAVPCCSFSLFSHAPSLVRYSSAALIFFIIIIQWHCKPERVSLFKINSTNLNKNIARTVNSYWLCAT